jgi:chloramphenicol-sensitive protein RarD
MAKGVLFAASAFLLWGLFPLYFKTLGALPPLELLAHRVVWSLVFVAIVLAARRQWAWLAALRKQPRVIALFSVSAALLAVNWCIYIWSVHNDRVVDASLGYFINPLVNVLLGLALLKERLRPGQWLAVLTAALGVAWLTWHSGQFPWIAISLALTFGFYGLIRKTGALGPLEGLALESMVLAPVGLVWLLWLSWSGSMVFAVSSPGIQLLTAASGPITAIPLLLFAAGARRIPLSVLGLLQYIGPSMQLVLGVLLYHEPFGQERLIGFAFIWLALAIYSAEGALRAWWTRAPLAREL